MHREIHRKYPQLNLAELIQLEDQIPRTPVEVYLLLGNKIDECGIDYILSMISAYMEKKM